MKKFLSIFLIIGLVFSTFMLTACSDEEKMEIEDDEWVEDEIIDEDVDMDVDEYSPIETLRSEIDPSCSVFYLERDGLTYTLGRRLHNVEDVQYTAGINHNHYGSTNDERMLYSQRIRRPHRMPEEVTGIFSYGDVPVITLQDGDRVVAHSESDVPEVNLFRVDLYGYALSMRYQEAGSTLSFFDPESGELYIFEKIDDFSVKDLNGNEVENYYNLNQGEIYAVSFYRGTEYVEYQIAADSYYYSFTSGSMETNPEPDYVLEAELSPDGAEYDFSDVDPGLYVISDGAYEGAVIEVQ